MSVVMGVMIVLMVVGFLGLGHHHGMMGGHDKEETKKESVILDPHQEAPCTDCPAGSELGNLILAQHEEKTVAGIKVVLAIVHVEEIKRHPEEHPEIKMHGGPKGTHHLLIHLEDEKTGEIISDASVTVHIHNPDGTKISKILEPMTINERTNFGNYFDFSDMGNYHVEAMITPEKGEHGRISAFFVYENKGH